jgi:flagellin-specific chaperone FliS
MDEFLDIVWLKIVAVTQAVVNVMDVIISPLNVLGPGMVIFMLVLVTVVFTKLFKRFYTTKRYEALKKEFNHWAEIRKQAMGIDNREKGKTLAKNIDQAKLNKIYYDYFFEGFLKNVLTTILPVLLMAAYVNEAYNPDRLSDLFGRSYVFKMPGFGGEPTPAGALVWFVLSLIWIHTLWAVTKKMLKKKNSSRVNGNSNNEKPGS